MLQLPLLMQQFFDLRSVQYVCHFVEPHAKMKSEIIHMSAKGHRIYIRATSVIFYQQNKNFIQLLTS